MHASLNQRKSICHFWKKDIHEYILVRNSLILGFC
jgi:hypothetical protein